MNDHAIEQEIQAKGLSAPRVKPEDLTANIADTEFVTHVAKSGQVLRWAILTTQSGFAVVGKPSVSVSPENDNEQIGRQVAYDNSRNELWPLMGYALKERLHNTQPPVDNAHVAPGCEQFSDQALTVSREGNTINFPLPSGGKIAVDLTSEQAAILDGGTVKQNTDAFKDLKVTQVDADGADCTANHRQ